MFLRERRRLDDFWFLSIYPKSEPGNLESEIESNFTLEHCLILLGVREKTRGIQTGATIIAGPLMFYFSWVVQYVK